MTDSQVILTVVCRGETFHSPPMAMTDAERQIGDLGAGIDGKSEGASVTLPWGTFRAVHLQSAVIEA